MKPGLFVLGMARSGTSAVTRVVNLLGIPTVREEDRKPPDDDNPLGYWESRALTNLNRRLLVAVAGPPYGPAPRFASEWLSIPAVVELREEARDLMRRTYPTTPWVWKDPRTSLTLPFWLQVADDVDPVVLLVYRDPLEVADSLVRRDDAPVPVTVAIWERYNRAALANAAGLPTFVVRYDGLVERPREVAAELATFLGDIGVAVSGPPDAIETFVDPALRRSRPDERVHTLPSAQQRELLSILDRLQGGHTALASVPLPDESPWVDGLLEAERVTGMLDHQRQRREDARRAERDTAGRTMFGVELRVRRGTPAWRALSAVRRLFRR